MSYIVASVCGCLVRVFFCVRVLIFGVSISKKQMCSPMARVMRRSSCLPAIAPNDPFCRFS